VPLNGPDLLEITVDGGASGRLGLYGRIGATVPVGERWRAGADVGIFTNRGVMAGPAFGYDWVEPDGSFAHGRFTSGYIHDSGDSGDLGTDILGDPIQPDRGLISWTHQQAFSPHLTLNGELNYWSDSEVLRDFRPRDFFPVQVPDTFVDLTYTSTNQVTGLFLRAQPNDFHAVRQRLPELTWELLPTPLDGGFVQQAQASLVSLRDDPPGPAAALSTKRADLYYALSRPWAPTPWFTTSPVAGGRFTHYTNAVGGRNDYTRELLEVGMDAEMRFSGTFDYENPRWGIDGLRHLVTPRLSYRYISDADEGAAYIPQIDRRVFATYLEPLALGARRQIDDLTATNTLRIALDQRLQTRDSDYGSRDLVQLNLALDSRFDTAPGERTLSALHTELRLSPASFLDFELYHRATPGNWTLRELNTAITLHDADLWQLQLATHYLEGELQEYIGSFAYRFNEVWQGYTRLHFDSRRSRFVEQRYGLRQTIANRWAIGYEITFSEGQRRESDFGFNVRFDAVSF
jgi:LPS-assembly protein